MKSFSRFVDCIGFFVYLKCCNGATTKQNTTMKNSIYNFKSVDALSVTGAFYKYVDGFFTKEYEEELLNGKNAFIMKSIQTGKSFYILASDCAKATIFDLRK